ncbi:MAG: TetR/AcrR family transcriptional regulator [Oscillospiraceae bacterium]|nr:TetR/AcrR family transcriptional regulator [Oscillospiraceae bacterium]
MKTDLRVIKTRAVIKNTLIELMSEREIAKITVSQLCERAKINRKTFYRHYREIGDVKAEIENEALEEFSQSFKSGSILNAQTIISSISGVLKQRREFYSRMLKFNPDLFSKGRLKTALCRTLAAAIRSAGSEKDESKLMSAAEFTAAGVFSLYSVWLEEGGDIDFITDISVKLVTGALSDFLPEKTGKYNT